MGVRVFQPEMLLVLLMYFPFFFVFFFSNSLRVNGAMRFEGQSESISRLIAGFANSAGFIPNNLLFSMPYSQPQEQCIGPLIGLV